MKSHVRRLSLILILVLLLGALATVTVMAQGDVAREDTVIFDIDASAVPNPTNFNDLVPGTQQEPGRTPGDVGTAVHPQLRDRRNSALDG